MPRFIVEARALDMLARAAFAAGLADRVTLRALKLRADLDEYTPAGRAGWPDAACFPILGQCGRLRSAISL